MDTKTDLESATRESADVIENFGLLLSGVSDLTKNEIRVAKLEMRDSFGSAVDTAVKKIFIQVLRMVLAVAGLCFLSTSAVFGLNEYLGQSYFVSLLVVGSLLTVVGIFIIPIIGKK